MNFLQGLMFNFKGLKLSLRTPKLFFLGALRLVAVVALTLGFFSVILVYYEEVLAMVWAPPSSRWLIWLWYIASWLVALLLTGFSALLSYLAAQVLFSVLIMDIMSTATERLITGAVEEARDVSTGKRLKMLFLQEIPRSVLPVLCSLALMVFGWLTPFGPALSPLGAVLALVFLAWDNTDLLPARRMAPLKTRLKFLIKTLPFHIGFGLWFLVPVLNIVFLSYAPVGATLYHLDVLKKRAEKISVQS